MTDEEDAHPNVAATTVTGAKGHLDDTNQLTGSGSGQVEENK